MKSYTDIEQSKKLAEILPIESADMYYLKRKINDTIETAIIKPVGNVDKSLCCWSLAALYNILPNNEKESTTLTRGCCNINTPEYIDNWWCEYENEITDFAVSADNPIDAVYKMIVWLKKENYI